MGSPFNLQKVGDPFNEVVTVSELKKHLRVSHSADDTYIGLLGEAARQMVEIDLNRQIVGQEYNLYLSYGWYNYEQWLGNGYSSLLIWSYLAAGASALWYPKIQLPITPAADRKSVV